MPDDVSRDDVNARVAAALSARPLLRNWGVAIVAAEAGRVTLRLSRLSDGHGPADNVADRPHGTFDRSIIVALGDAACWLAVIGLVKPNCAVATLEMKVDLIVTREPLVVLEATSEVQRNGRSLSATRATVSGLGRHGDRHKVGLIQATMLVSASDG